MTATRRPNRERRDMRKLADPDTESAKGFSALSASGGSPGRFYFDPGFFRSKFCDSVGAVISTVWPLPMALFGISSREAFFASCLAAAWPFFAICAGSILLLSYDIGPVTL